VVARLSEGRPRRSPIHRELKPDLEQALRRAKSHLVFPAPDGKILQRDFKLTEKLRSAMARAGVLPAAANDEGPTEGQTQTARTLRRMDWSGKRESNPRPSA